MKNETENEQTERVTAFLRGVVEAFTDHHEDLTIEARALGRVMIVVLQAHAAETPRIIGSQGKHVSALQTLLDRVGRRMEKRIRLEIKEAQRGEKRPLRPYEANDEWNPEPMRKLLARIVRETIGHPNPKVQYDRVENCCNFRVEQRAGEDLELDPELANAIDRLLCAVGRHQGQQVFLDSAALTR